MSSHSSRVTHARAQHVQGDTDGTEVVGIYAAAAAQGRVSPAGAQQGSNGTPGIPGRTPGICVPSIKSFFFPPFFLRGCIRSAALVSPKQC